MKRILIACALVCAGSNAIGCDLIGVLDGLALGKSRVDKVPQDAASIDRTSDDGKSREKKDVFNGMVLCRGDRLTTATNVTAVLKLGAAGPEQKQITVEPGTTLDLADDKKIEVDGASGGIFARVKGLFDTIFDFGMVSSNSTLYAVHLDNAGARITQFEHETRFTKPGEQTPSLTIPPNNDAAVGVAARAPAPMPPSLCRSLMDPNSEVVAETRAKRPSLPVGKNFTRETIAKIFADARAGALCRDPAKGDAKADAARELLGLVYADWTDPSQALQWLESLPPGASPEEQARHFTAWGQALRLQGEPEMAAGKFQAALGVRPNYAPAENGMGDALRDQGLKAFGLTVKSAQNAAAFFDRARAAYESATKHGEGTPAAELGRVNVGNLLLLQAGVTPDRGDELLDAAAAAFDDALGLTAGRSMQARLGFARLEMQRAQLIPAKSVDANGLTVGQVFAANVIYALQADRERTPVRERARAILKALVADEPDFAPGWQTLGEVSMQLNDSKQAKASLLHAISSDPHYTLSYHQLARVASKTYEDAYKAVEYPAMAAVAKQRERITNTTAPAVTVPSGLLVPSLSTLRFDYGTQSPARTVTFQNVSETPVTPVSVAITGDDASAFAITSNGCGNQPMAPKGECRVVVQFHGAPAGTRKATLEVSTGGPISTSVALRALVSASPAGVPVIL